MRHQDGRLSLGFFLVNLYIESLHHVGSFPEKQIEFVFAATDLVRDGIRVPADILIVLLHLAEPRNFRLDPLGDVFEGLISPPSAKTFFE
jgi:hypothetical protein